MSEAGKDERVRAQAEELSALLEERLRIKGETLRERLERTGRRVRGRARAQLAIVAEAELQADHPKLRHLIDTARVDAAHAEAREVLEAINPHYRLRGQILSILGSIVFALIVVAAAFIYWARSRGYL